MIYIFGGLSTSAFCKRLHMMVNLMNPCTLSLNPLLNQISPWLQPVIEYITIESHQNSHQKSSKIPIVSIVSGFLMIQNSSQFCPVAWHHATRPHLPPGYCKALRVKITMFNK